MTKDISLLMEQLCLLAIKTRFFKRKKMSHPEEIDLQLRFIFPFSCLIVGPSGCGKTYFVKNVLEN